MYQCLLCSYDNNIYETIIMECYFIPNHTFLVKFGGIYYKVSLVKLWMLVRILERCYSAKIPMARPNKHDIPSTHTKTKRTEWVLLYPNSAK